MNDRQILCSCFQTDTKHVSFASISSYILAILTFITFVAALFAVPISGATVAGGGISYPYLGTVEQYPRDYIWQYMAMLMICIYLINIIAIKHIVRKDKQIYMNIGSIFAIIASATLMINYYIHVSIVPVSLMNNEYDGISLLTQYNPHGLFIALEELGYILMVVSFGFLAIVFYEKDTKAIAVIYYSAVAVAISSLILINIEYGLEKLDRYEIVILTTAWLALIINGILIGNRVRRLCRVLKT